MNVKALRVFVVLSLFGILCISVTAQTTAFTYQGSLKDGANAANGSFQMQFKLFDAVSAGTQIGSTIADVPVTVTQGTFSVQLDFGSNALNGANRWLEIAVRHNSGEGYSTLSPRQQIGSSPYSVRTLSAASADTALDSQKLGGVAANQYVQTSDPRLSDARNPLPNSSSYIQNTTAQQAGSNFNISGNGTAGRGLPGEPASSVQKKNHSGHPGHRQRPGHNVFIGVNAGASNTSGESNTMVGTATGNVNAFGSRNSYFGAGAGQTNINSSDNSFFGNTAGHDLSSGSGNSFFGSSAGSTSTTGGNNSFFGLNSGLSNRGGTNNTAGGGKGDKGGGRVLFLKKKRGRCPRVPPCRNRNGEQHDNVGTLGNR